MSSNNYKVKAKEGCVTVPAIITLTMKWFGFAINTSDEILAQLS